MPHWFSLWERLHYWLKRLREEFLSTALAGQKAKGNLKHAVTCDISIAKRFRSSSYYKTFRSRVQAMLRCIWYNGKSCRRELSTVTRTSVLLVPRFDRVSIIGLAGLLLQFQVPNLGHLPC